MNGTGAQIKQAAINKAKQVAGASSSNSNSNGNSNKKRKKELKPIITTDGPPQGTSHGHDAEMASSNLGYVESEFFVCRLDDVAARTKKRRESGTKTRSLIFIFILILQRAADILAILILSSPTYLYILSSLLLSLPLISTSASTTHTYYLHTRSALPSSPLPPQSSIASSFPFLAAQPLLRKQFTPPLSIHPLKQPKMLHTRLRLRHFHSHHDFAAQDPANHK